MRPPPTRSRFAVSTSTVRPRLRLGLNGIRYIAGGEVNVENCKIHGSTAADPHRNGVLVGVGNFAVLTLNGVDAGQNTFVFVSESVFSVNGGTAILASTATSTVYARNNLITNTGTGISANVSGAKINALGNSIFGNSKAFNVAAGGTFPSAGDNKFDVNPGNNATGTLGTK